MNTQDLQTDQKNHLRTFITLATKPFAGEGLLSNKKTRSSTVWKVSKYGVFYGVYFPVFGLNTEFSRSEDMNESVYVAMMIIGVMSAGGFWTLDQDERSSRIDASNLWQKITMWEMARWLERFMYTVGTKTSIIAYFAPRYLNEDRKKNICQTIAW